MNKQIMMLEINDELGQTVTRKKEFLEQINRIIPWEEWERIIEPHYYKRARGNMPFELELILKIHLLQNMYSLSDMDAMMEIIDSRAFSEFCGVDSGNQVPDGIPSGGFARSPGVRVQSTREPADSAGGGQGQAVLEEDHQLPHYGSPRENRHIPLPGALLDRQVDRLAKGFTGMDGLASCENLPRRWWYRPGGYLKYISAASQHLP